MKFHLPLFAGGLIFLSTAAIGCSDSTASAPNSAASSSPGAQTAAPAAAAGKAQGLFTSDAKRLFADYKRDCAGKSPRSRKCELLRSLVVVEIYMGLDLLERSRDQRGVAQALSALDFPEEPEIFVAGLRILARFPTTPGIADKLFPQLFLNRYLEVQKIGASLLTSLPDTAVAEVGRLWLGNHGGLEVETPYDQYADFPSHYAAIGFPKYPGAEWFSPADSDRSIGWSTKDDAAAVTKWFSQALKAEAVDGNKWFEQQQQEMRQAVQSNQTRTQELVEKAIKGDTAAKAELEKLQKQMQDAGAQLAKGFMDTTPPQSAGAEARWIVAKKKDGRVSTMVMIYPMPAVQRTVIQVAWHLADYPSAWPTK